MRLSDQNRVAMLTAVFGVVTSEQYQPVYADHLAFSEAVDSLSHILTAVDAQNQVAQGNPGASNVKEQARLGLCACACEVIGAIKAYCAVASDPELCGKVNFTTSTVTAGNVNQVVARCKTIHTAANENIEALGKYGITATKLTKFKNAIAAFDKVKTAPRQHRVTKSAATRLLPQLVRSGMSIVRNQMDGLMPQFKESAPNFFQEYQAARVIVDHRGRRVNGAESSTTPPVAKAA
jgi:hypothetical protein